MTAPRMEDGPSIVLQNPVGEHFAAFIAGNGIMWEKRAVEALQAQVTPERWEALCDAPDAVWFRRALLSELNDPGVVRQDEWAGKHVVICGAGPSLRETMRDVLPTADVVMGCNSALPYLLAQGQKVTHGFCIDQTAHMLAEWSTMPDVEYLLASSVHPHLTEALMAKGRRIRVFHNFVGVKEKPVAYGGRTMEFEDWLYASLFPGTVRAGAGLNATTRAIDVALFGGAAKVTVLGADCALRATKPMPVCVVGSPEHQRWLMEDVEMHADGGHALASGATMMTFTGDICPCDANECDHPKRTWVTKPDMMISAVFLVWMMRQYGERLSLLGDTLPNALKDKPAAFLNRLPTLTTPNGEPMRLFGSTANAFLTPALSATP